MPNNDVGQPPVAEATVRLLIPAAVVDHWEPKFDDVRRHGICCDSDRTYAKVLEAVRPGKRAIIDAAPADIAELREECSAQLDDETEVATSNEICYRRYRWGYRKLRDSLKRLSVTA